MKEAGSLYVYMPPMQPEAHRTITAVAKRFDLTMMTHPYLPRDTVYATEKPIEWPESL